MRIRLSIGVGPLRASVPFGPRRRRSRAVALHRRAPSFHGIARFTDGSVYTCQHVHGTAAAAAACAARYMRDVAAGRPVPPPVRLRRT